MNWRLLIRELRHGRLQALIFILCVALSISSIVAIDSFRRDVLQLVSNDGRALQGGDLIVRSRAPFSPSLVSALEQLQEQGRAEVSRSQVFNSMVRGLEKDGTLLCEIKTVQDNYPLYGKVVLQSASDLAGILLPGTVVVAPAVLSRLGLQQGDQLQLGQARFTIAGLVVSESARPVEFLSFGPRIFLRSADLAATGLVGMGSRVSHHAYLRVPPNLALTEIQGQLESRLAAGERVDRWDRSDSRVGRFFDNLFFFLSLVAVFSLLLGGIGIQSSVTALVRDKEKTIAILRVQGASSTFVIGHYLGLVLAIGLAGCILGLVGAAAVKYCLLQFFAELLPSGLSFRFLLHDLIEGMGIGLVVVLFFTAWPVYRLRAVKPNEVLHQRPSLPRNHKGPLLFLLAGVVLLLGLIFRRVDDLKIALMFLAGFLVVILLSRVLVSGGMRLLSRLDHPLLVRQAVRSLWRPGNATATVATTLACSISALLVLLLVEGNLRATYVASYPKEAPNLFAIDIQKDQREGFQNLLERDAELFAVVRGRLLSINGQEVQREKRKARGDSLTRQFNLTYRAELLPDETLVQGQSLWGGQIVSGTVPVSILDTVEDMGNLKVGDVLLFNIQGVELAATVTSVRSRTRSMLYPFFYFVFQPKVLERAPQTFFAAMHLEERTISGVQDRIVKAYPNISTIDVSQLAKDMEGLMARLSRVIYFFAGVSTLAGLLILVGSILATQKTRAQETVYLRVVGADSRFIFMVLVVENLGIALLACLSGVAVGQLAGWAVCRFVLDLSYQGFWYTSLGLCLLATVSVVLAGSLGGLSAAARKPSSLLRELH